MDAQERREVMAGILQAVRNLQCQPESWVDLAPLGVQLNAAGIQYKELGFFKLRHMLNEFADVLEFRDVVLENKPPVYYVRPKAEPDPHAAPVEREAPAAPAEKPGKFPNKDSWLFTWASVPFGQIRALADLALEERWYYGDERGGSAEDLPILKNYLAYTFKRLCFENKIMYATDPVRNEDYAAFNTGLVDRKYENIYALFKENTRFPTPYWYLLGFVVAGEDGGKTLVRLFNPLPKKADYFENKIENMLFDSSTGDLSCDYTHILTEHSERLPLEFLKENCPADFMTIDGVSIDDVYHRSRDYGKTVFFEKLGRMIKENPRILNRLKNRLDDAVKIAKKRVEWNYKTAIPMYYPAQNSASLLLPLALMDEDKIDLALVVERQISGAYQGQTILPLYLAYSNSRLVTRPDSDWLKTDTIFVDDGEDLDDEV